MFLRIDESPDWQYFYIAIRCLPSLLPAYSPAVHHLLLLMCVVIRRHPLPAENMTSAVRRQKNLDRRLGSWRQALWQKCGFARCFPGFYRIAKRQKDLRQLSFQVTSGTRKQVFAFGILQSGCAKEDFSYTDYILSDSNCQEI